MGEETTNLPVISVRRIREEEKKAVRSLAGRVFPPLGSVFFSPSQHTLVAERDGQVVGEWCSSSSRCPTSAGAARYSG
jgi:hypothetical protein